MHFFEFTRFCPILCMVGLICTPVCGCEISYCSSFHPLLGLSDTIFTQTDAYEMVFHFCSFVFSQSLVMLNIWFHIFYWPFMFPLRQIALFYPLPSFPIGYLYFFLLMFKLLIFSLLYVQQTSSPCWLLFSLNCFWSVAPHRDCVTPNMQLHKFSKLHMSVSPTQVRALPGPEAPPHPSNRCLPSDPLTSGLCW